MKRRKVLLVILIPLIVLTIYIGWLAFHMDEQKSACSSPYIYASVTTVIDGDTLDLESGERVRVLGINTPEKGEEFYQEAKDRLEELVGGKKVKLVSDEEDTGKYGRLLRYVFIDDIFVNALLVEEGLATVYLLGDSICETELRAAEARCKEKEIKLCKTSKSECSKCIEIAEFHWDAEGDDRENLNNEYVTFKNICSIDCDLNNWIVKDETNSHIYTFKNFIFEAGSEVTLHSGSSSDSKTRLYWASKSSVWNNAGDTLFMKDTNGDLVLQEHYEGKR